MERTASLGENIFQIRSWSNLLILSAHFSQRCSVKYRDRCVRSWLVYSSTPGVWPTSPPSPRPCLIGSPSTAPTTTTHYLWPSTGEKVAYSLQPPPPPPSTHKMLICWQIHAICLKNLNKCVRSRQSVEMKSSAVFCINDKITFN